MEDIRSPDVTSPMTQLSRPSTISSVGTIPDFPIPVPPPTLPGPPRRSGNLGPPPSSRRGASSYYSQASFVSPIPEESPRTIPTHLSYASSAAIPSSWGSESPGYQYDEDDHRSYENGLIEEGRESRESNGDDSDDRGLIRSASLGKRAKPSMITTRSSEKLDPTRPAATPQQSQQMQAPRSKLERMGVLDSAGPGPKVATATAVMASRMKDGQRQTVWPTVGNADSPLASGTGLIDNSSSSSSTSVPTIGRAVTADEVATSHPTDSNSNVNPILGAYNAASSLQPGDATPTRTPSPGFSRLSAIRRPPRLDIDAVRDAEARGSLTSLPDLIRRATRLAAMMDRGKRPGSRLNDLSDFPSDIDLSSRDKDMGREYPTFKLRQQLTEIVSGDEKRHSGLSGMLSAFPPPGLGTPREGTPRHVSSWPQGFGQSATDLNANSSNKKKGRRCCGLPCWGFLLLLLVLLVIIAAAVVVPLEFLVLNKKSTTSTPSPLQKCQQDSTTACQNGGTSSLATGSCSCICINGFSGSTCAIASAGGCTTITLQDSSVSNATLGDSIPRLITSAQSNFSIPLSENIILARFNTADLSCASQNALVTFDGQSQRVGTANQVVQPTSTASSSATATPDTRRRRQATTTSSSPTAATTNGILYDPTTVGSSSSSSTGSALPNAAFNITEEVLDFARVVVLFVLQQDNFDDAVNAQSNFQHVFSLQTFTNAAAKNISLGNGNSANLLEFKVDLGNGSFGSGGNSTSSKRSLMGRSTNLWNAL